MKLWQTHGRSRYITDKQDGHSYLPEYDNLFLPYRDKPITILELGHSAGGALRLFDDYFTHPETKILGIDLTDNDWEYHYQKKPYETSRVKRYLIDIHDLNEKWFADNDVHPDIMIDDSDHNLDTQIFIITQLMRFVNKGGLLIIEDILYPEVRAKEFCKLDPIFELVDLNGVKDTKDNALLIYRT